MKKKTLSGKLSATKKPSVAAAPAKNEASVTKKLSMALNRHSINP